MKLAEGIRNLTPASIVLYTVLTLVIGYVVLNLVILIDSYPSLWNAARMKDRVAVEEIKAGLNSTIKWEDVKDFGLCQAFPQEYTDNTGIVVFLKPIRGIMIMEGSPLMGHYGLIIASDDIDPQEVAYAIQRMGITKYRVLEPGVIAVVGK